MSEARTEDEKEAGLFSGEGVGRVAEGDKVVPKLDHLGLLSPIDYQTELTLT